jgi:hypothetical protein
MFGLCQLQKTSRNLKRSDAFRTENVHLENAVNKVTTCIKTENIRTKMRGRKTNLVLT